MKNNIEVGETVSCQTFRGIITGVVKTVYNDNTFDVEDQKSGELWKLEFGAVVEND